MTEKNRIAYICDGKDHCCQEPGCFMWEEYAADTDMICRHTINPEHAVNGVCEDPENHPERFVCYVDGHLIRKYYERLPDEEV